MTSRQESTSSPGLAGSGGLAALDALGQALDQATDVLSGDAVGTPAAAFRAVAAADRALTQAPAFFAALSAVMERGEPAPEIAADLVSYADELAELDRRIAPRRERLAELRDAADRLKAEAAARDEIEAEIAELTRIEQLAGHVADLRTQRDELAERAKTVAAVAGNAEAGLVASAESLVTLTAETFDSLTERTRELLVRAAEEDRALKERVGEHRQAAERARAQTERSRAELAEAEAEAAREQDTYESTRARAAGRLAELRRYQAANRAVAEALVRRPAAADGAAATGKEETDPDPVAAALRNLGDVETRLADIDGLLAAALAADDWDGDRGVEPRESAIRRPPEPGSTRAEEG